MVGSNMTPSSTAGMHEWRRRWWWRLQADWMVALHCIDTNGLMVTHQDNRNRRLECAQQAACDRGHVRSLGRSTVSLFRFGLMCLFACEHWIVIIWSVVHGRRRRRGLTITLYHSFIAAVGADQPAMIMPRLVGTTTQPVASCACCDCCSSSSMMMSLADRSRATTSCDEREQNDDALHQNRSRARWLTINSWFVCCCCWC